MKTLNIGSLKIPVTFATKSNAFLAKRGAGKTYTAAVFAEELAKAGIPFVVFDPIDVWWGLRLAANGKDKGLPVVVFGLEHADILITRDDGPRIARAIVKENISCVISTFGMSKTAMRHLIAEFSEELLKINDTPRHIFIEEAHEFVPQRVQSGAGKCFAAVEALVVMGRNRGLGVSLINQRAATLNKDVLTQVDNLIAMRSVGPQDRKALKEWVEFHSAEGDFNDFINTLPSLPTGEAWFWSPEFMGIFEKIKIRKRETFHPDREKLGQNFKVPVLSQTDIASFVEAFKEKPKAATVSSIDLKVLSTKVTEPLVFDKQLSKDNELLKNQVATLNSAVEKWTAYATMLELQLKEFSKTIDFVIRNERPTSKSILVTQKNVTLVMEKTRAAVTKTQEPVETSGEELKLGKAEKKIYSFLMVNGGRYFTKAQLGGVTGYSHNSSSFNNAIYRLNTLGLINRDAGSIGLKEVRPELAEPAEAYSQQIWYSKLGKAERAIYVYLSDNPTLAFYKEEIAGAVEYSATSSSFNNAIYRLNSLGLLRRADGLIRLNPELLDL